MATSRRVIATVNHTYARQGIRLMSQPDCDLVLERLNVERPVIVGHSWGTLVALALAVGRWRDIRGLVLLSGYYYPTRRADVALSAPLAIPGFGDAARSLVPQTVGHLLAPQMFRHVFWPQPVPARFKTR